MILDTHKEIGHLKELGFDEKKAEGIVQLHLRNGEHLATKADIARLQDKMETNNKWMMAILLTILTVVFTLYFKL